MLLVTSSITVPVGFFFYMPDPALKQWDKEDKRLKKSGIAKKDRPIKPERDSAYPTKTEIALGLFYNPPANPDKKSKQSYSKLVTICKKLEY
ncbi:hypothetical protein [Bathymodiolus japonicus methanotrophic gill symbiont]|uniref:hypothetical protein n=1 Tax=Bathymodiolus japonicus methanotrophic gill symbiont TaxID=113269 RepID=UPI001C8EC25B|nr:hypothetical protein [Bathymodiolus japonicus methanotrophic gill symbiont]